MSRLLLGVTLVGAIGLAIVSAIQGQPTTPPATGKAGRDVRPAASIPLTHVVLFSSGVGYFQREGEVDGNAKVELTFPASDVNDLIKSLVLQDTGRGRISAINYDSQDPVERTLRTFALDLTANPSLTQLLNMARGEKVEVTLQAPAPGPSGSVMGVILGMEVRKQPRDKDTVVETDYLNLITSDGIRGVPMPLIQRVRFLNPTVEAELTRALEVIAGARDAQKKTVALNFRGEGKRAVKVGYVVESPIWKTSYRLILNPEGKANLQAWGVIENTTEEDWNGVKMALVSGRPISYMMDLYPPLYVPRPTVELEKYASLRPPMYGGAMPAFAGAGPGGPGGNPAPAGNLGGAGFQGGFGGGFNGQLNNRAPGSNAMPQVNGLNAAANDTPDQQAFNARNRLDFEQLMKRRQEMNNEKLKAASAGRKIAGLDPTEGMASVATIEELGDVCQYAIDEPVNLARLRSAMLPILDQKVEATKLSIFNESVHAKYPLLGVRFKNASSQPLMQGPVTVYEGAGYAGDTRFPDMQPGEERIVSFAMDVGTEVKAEGSGGSQRVDAYKIVKGSLHATNKFRSSKRYLVKNRSSVNRTLVIEHPVREGWELIAPLKPAERSRDVYRFVVPVDAGASATLEVSEEMRKVEVMVLSEKSAELMTAVLRSPVTSPKMKEAIEKLVALQSKLVDASNEANQSQEQLKAITEDQARLRANFANLPPTSEAYKRYLAKFDSQESEIEKLQAEIKARKSVQAARKADFDQYLASLNID